MSHFYVIGDVHGHLDKLKTIHDWVDKDQAVNGFGPVVHVGDLVDRGPDSKGVLDFLVSGISRGADWIVIKGNHDRMMQWYLEAAPKRDPRLRAQFEWLHPALGGDLTLNSYGIDPAALAGAHWLHPKGGGSETLSSYGVEAHLTPEDLHARARELVPSSHLKFISELPIMYENDDVAVVHAGIRPGLDLADQTEDDLLWIRSEFHDWKSDHPKLIIHGHTPVEAVTHYGNRVNVDTGAGHGRNLSVIVVEGRRVTLLTECGRQNLSVVG